LPAGGDRAPEDALGDRPHAEGPGGRLSRAARGAGARAAEEDRNVSPPRGSGADPGPERIETPGTAPSTIWVGSGLLDAAGRYLASPSGRFLVIGAASARPWTERILASLPGPPPLALTIADGEPAETLAAVEAIADAPVSPRL